jgi:uncharacterized protein YcaQ
MPSLNLDQLRRYAIARSLFRPTNLQRAVQRLGFVQADPIRAPARAQDLVLRHRVVDYRAGDLEAKYEALPIEEEFFINYGFLSREQQQLMHPRTARRVWSKARRAEADAVLDFVKQRGVVHPREVNEAFDHGKTQNWFGGRSNASTQLLDGMHYRGLLRVARRENGVRLYAPQITHDQQPPHPDDAFDALIDLAVRTYAPLPAPSLGRLVTTLVTGAVPQWRDRRREALARAKARTSHQAVDGLLWYWPAEENPLSKGHQLDEELRVLAPFDPVVWDRHRFELFWRWSYRFEAYTPAQKRVRGYYAMPMLWRGQVLGWANATTSGDRLTVQPGFVSGSPPADPAFKRAFGHEVERLQEFLNPRRRAGPRVRRGSQTSREHADNS